MSRLDRLSAHAYAQLAVDRQQAVDTLRWLAPSEAERAEAKTLLGWKRARSETIALADELRAQGLVPAAIADRLGVSDRYVAELLRNPASHAGGNATNRQRQGDLLAVPLRGSHAARVEHGEAS